MFNFSIIVQEKSFTIKLWPILDDIPVRNICSKTTFFYMNGSNARYLNENKILHEVIGYLKSSVIMFSVKNKKNKK